MSTPSFSAVSTEQLTTIGNMLHKWNIVCVITCLLLATLAFISRVYVRLFIRKEWNLEDGMAALSWTGLVILCGLTTKSAAKYDEIRTMDWSSSLIIRAIYWFRTASTTYSAAILVTKLTILSMYRRVFVVQRRGFLNIFLYCFETILILFYTSCVLAKIFACDPVQKFWDTTIPGKCIRMSILVNTSGVFNFVTDFVMLLIPIRSVWSLQMPARKKIYSVLLFSFGMIGPIFAILGFTAREKGSSRPETFPLVMLWTIAEVTVGVMCICLPSATLIFRKPEPKGPLEEIINGTPDVMASGTFQSRPNPRSMYGILDEEEGEYFELREMEVDGIERPPKAYRPKILERARSHRRGASSEVPRRGGRGRMRYSLP